MGSLKAKRVHHKPLRDFVKSLLLIDDSVYFTLGGGKVTAAMYTQAKDTALLRSVDSSTLLECPDPDQPIRVGLYKGQPPKLLKYLDSFDPETTTAEIHTAVHRSDGKTYAKQIDLRDSKLRMSVPCMDPGLGFVEMTDQQADRAFSDPSPLYSFVIGADDMQKLIKLTAFIADDNKLISIGCDGSKVSATCDLFDLELDPSPKIAPAFSPGIPAQLFKKFFERIPAENYDVSVYKTKAVMASRKNDVKMAINLAIQA